MSIKIRHPALLAALYAVCLCPKAYASVGKDIPSERLFVAAAPVQEASVGAPTAEGTGALGPLGDLKSGGAGEEIPQLGSVGNVRSGGGGGLEATTGTAMEPGTPLGGGTTPPAVGGTEVDLVSALFNGDAGAFTAAVLASGAFGAVPCCWANTVTMTRHASLVTLVAYCMQAPALPRLPSRAACSCPTTAPSALYGRHWLARSLARQP
jgi:hypothetical protein